MATFLSLSNLADILGVSIATTRKWWETRTYPPHTDGKGRQGENFPSQLRRALPSVALPLGVQRGGL